MKALSKTELYRQLPSVDELVRRPEVAPLVSTEGQSTVAEAARAVLTRVRTEIASGCLDAETLPFALAGLPRAVQCQARGAIAYSLSTVINATGVILHTNLGRAPLAASALEHIRETAARYSNLEFDVATGERGERDVHVDRLFRKLLAENAGTPVPGSAEERSFPSVSTIVVNNNAAAVLLALNTLAEGGEAIVSRGELVEIGGSFRIPEVMAKSNATLREVGSTNRTRLADYERAINDKTRLLLRVHRSNFQITGFTEQPKLDQLVDLARKHNVPLVEDLGSGAIFDLRSIGVSGEADVLGSLRAGVDVVTYSGDKLLGGPQAGMLSGRRDLIVRMRANSLFRALRVDKLTYAALEATLLAYVKRDYGAIPVLRMMRMRKEEIGKRAQAMAQAIQAHNLPFEVEVVDGESVIGGGAAPSATLPTRLLMVARAGLSADELAARLRDSRPSVIARVEQGRVVLDLRTVFPEQDDALKKVVFDVATA